MEGNQENEFNKLFLEYLQKISNYLHFLSYNQLKEAIPKILDTQEKLLVYEACDGKCGVNEIARKTGINAMTVSNYLKYFETNGIVIQNWFKNQKRSIKIVGLQQLGIPVPKMKKR
ncbi:MAG: hypothetical protein HY929_05390, partial [Euryarchaeota archaeon]|nr:hypothetical protein [Euryarchaeota archaeon]